MLFAINQNIIDLKEVIFIKYNDTHNELRIKFKNVEEIMIINNIDDRQYLEIQFYILKSQFEPGTRDNYNVAKDCYQKTTFKKVI